MGYTAIWAGLAAAPMGVLPLMMTPIIGRYASKFDLRILASLSFLTMGLRALSVRNSIPMWISVISPKCAVYGDWRGILLYANHYHSAMKS